VNGPTPSLNIEYILLQTYDFLSSLHFDTAHIPHWVSSTVQGVLIFGMILSFILLVLLVYAQIRMVQVEHEGFHALEEKEHETIAHTHGPEGEGRNSRWDAIVALAASPNESDWRRAILEADIMMSDVLREQGFEGATVADQLRMANPFQMTTLDAAWSAHKLRNKVAHEGNALVLTERDVRATIDNYKRVFEEFAAI